MEPTRHRLHPLFGYELVGIDIKRALSAGEVRFVSDSIAEGGILVLRATGADQDDLARFAQNFGSITTFPMVREGHRQILRISNMDDNGNILPQTHRSQQGHIANELWHTDSSYLRPRSTLTFLLCYVTPPVGANTEFCDMRVAYENLPDTMRQRLEGRSAHHSILHSRKLTGFTDWSERERELLKGVTRPLIHIHKPSGRKSLCLASHISAIDGMTAAETQALVNQLTVAATTPDRVHAHVWQPGDVVIWDNLCTMHRATPFDSQRYPRDLRTVRLDDLSDVVAGEITDPVAAAAY